MQIFVSGMLYGYTQITEAVSIALPLPEIAALGVLAHENRVQKNNATRVE
jgi:hypothetical protein